MDTETEIADGKIQHLKTMRKIDAATAVEAIIEQAEYQQITVVVKGGKVVAQRQEVTEKP